MYRGNPAVRWIWGFVRGDGLGEFAAIVRGERPNDQDYDRDLRTHELTLAACRLTVG